MANPWDNDPVVGSAPAPSGGGVMLGTRDPYKVRDQQLQEEAAQRAQEDQRFQREKFEREMAKGADGEAGVEQSKAGGFYGRALKANQAYEQTGVGSQSTLTTAVRAITPEALEPLIIGPERQQAEANVRAFISSVLRYESGAAIPPEEFESAYKTYFPQPNEDPATAQTKARLRAEAIDAIRMGAGPAAAQADAGVDRSTNPLENFEGQGVEQIAPSTNGSRTVDNPELSGVRGEYIRRLEAGQSAGEIIPFLRQAGITDAKVLRSALEQIQFRKAHPNIPVSHYNTGAMDDMDVPLSGVESAMNSAAQSAPGAYAMQAGQMLSMNTLDNMAPNQERAQIGFDDAARNHPVASLAGGVTGGVMAALGGEAGLARAGMGAGIKRAGLADLAFGAGAGAGDTEDGSSRLVGAAKGAGAAVAGHAAGRVVTGGSASAISPTGGSLSDLYAAGVRPTPGQRALAAGGGKGLSGLAGRAVNAAEEGISSVPIVGSAIRGARQDARDQFQVGAFNQALGDIGEQLPKGMPVGTAPHAYAQKAFDRVYDKARSGMNLAADADLATDIAALKGQVDTLAEPSIKRFETILKNVVLRRVTGASVPGDAYKKIQSEVGEKIRRIRKNPSGDGELADALEDLSHALDGAARRNSSPEAAKLLDDADRGYAKFVLIEKASELRGGPPGTFSPSQFDRKVQSSGSRVRSKAYLQGEGLMQDYAEQGASLVDRMPNSGSADRLFMGAGAAGAGYAIEPASLTLLGALGVLYAPGVRKGMAGAMAPRGAKAKAIAQAIRERKRLAGAAGATMAVQGTSPDR